MNYKKMVHDINELVDNDFCLDMVCYSSEKYGHQRDITQEEARKMARIIDDVYGISHGIYCKSCGHKYSLK